VAEQEGLHFVPSFHPDLVKGVSTYALELFRAVPDLDMIYAPIGLGSGICGLIEVRDLLGLRTEIVGVVADNAPAVAHSFEAGRAVSSNSAQTFADGMAVREPHSGALEMICRGVSRVETIGEDQIAEAMRIYYTDTHNIAEGAGAAPLAALLKDGPRARGKKVAVILSGGNVDREMFLQVLQGQTPRV